MSTAFQDDAFQDDAFQFEEAEVSQPTLPGGDRPASVIGWEIDGRPVQLVGDWQADVTTGWGDRTLTGTLGRDVTWATQEAPIVGWRSSGEPLWQGRLTADPKIEGDVMTFRAEGHANRLAANPTRLLYRHDGGDGWTSVDSDPHNYDTAADEEYNVDVRPGKLNFFIEPGSFNTNDRNGMLLWAEGAILQQLSFIYLKQNSQANFELLVRQATGPTGSFTTPADAGAVTLTSGAGLASGTEVNVTLDDPDADMVACFINCNTGVATPAGRRRFGMSRLRVYGRTTDDAFTASEVVADVAGLSGFGTDGIDANALAILPLDWTDPHPGLLDYMAELTDWRWMVRGDEMTFGPYGRIWESATGVGAAPNLEPEPRANLFKQPFRAASGRLRTATASPTVDPFPGQEVVVWGEELIDPQENATLATAVAAAAIEYEALVRRSGPVELTEVRYQGGRWSPYDVNAGDQLLLTDLAPRLGAQRIEAMTYRPGGVATATLGSAFNLVQTLAELERPPRRRRRKRRRRFGERG